jgi:tetratricopeptide (TPR) repeat protein
MSKAKRVSRPYGWLITRQQYNKYYEQAQARLASADYTGVLAIGKTILRYLPRNARERGDVLHVMGLAASFLEEFEQSYQYLTEALTLLPDDPMLSYNRGLSSRFCMRLGQSLRDFERAAALDTKHQLSDKTAKALKFAHELVENDLHLRGPNFTLEQLIEQEGAFHDGVQAMTRHAWAEAERLFRRVVSMADVLPQPHGNLGLCLIMQNQLDEAEIELKRALEIDPQYDLAQQNLRALDETRRTGQPPRLGGMRDPLKGRGLPQGLTPIDH